jgi:Predicted membrane protein
MIGSRRRRHRAAVQAASAGIPPNQAVRENFSALDRAAIAVTDKVGTMGFFLIIVTWTVLWTGYNILATKVSGLHWHAFDPFPAFVAYLLVSNVIQITLMPLIMVGQNMQARHSEARAEADYLVNQKAFADTEAILARLAAQDSHILELARLNHTILEGLGRVPGSTDIDGGPVESGGGPSESGGGQPTV